MAPNAIQRHVVAVWKDSDFRSHKAMREKAARRLADEPAHSGILAINKARTMVRLLDADEGMYSKWSDEELDEVAIRDLFLAGGFWVEVSLDTPVRRTRSGKGKRKVATRKVNRRKS
jgi:hypothetical protein